MRNVRTQYPKSLRHEIVRVYLTGENSYEELASIYNVPITNVRTWVARYRHSINVVSLRSETNPIEDMARRKKEEKSAEVLQLEARIRELELQNLVLNMLIAENFHNWQRVGYEDTYHNEPEYCYSATLDEIEKKGWSLVPSKYIEFCNRDEQIDFDTKMRQLQAEMRDLLQQEEESKQQLKELFEKLGYNL